MKSSDLIVKMLALYDVEVIFGVPGDTSIPLYESLYDSGTIRHVMARDERSAAFMADAYARISHKPGICECPSGAGALYAIPGVAEADASSVPVILITNDIPISGEGKKTITELDCERLFAPVTKWSCLVKDGERIPEIVRRAFRMATTGRPGAVHLCIPQEAFKHHSTAEKHTLYAEPECRAYPAFRTRGSRKGLEAITRCLGAAERPVIVAGGGAKHSQAQREILTLCELLKVPVVTTISGQGILPDDHALALGVIGDNGYHPHAVRAMEESDTLLYVGCKIGSVSSVNWTLPAHDPERKILQVDLDPVMLGNNTDNHLSVAGDARLVLGDLNILLGEYLEGNPEPESRAPWVASLNQDRQAFWAESEGKLASTTSPIKPQRLISALNRFLDRTSIVISDAGTPTPHITRYLRLSGKDSTFIIPRAFGGLGYAIPGLVGAHLANPEARLVGLFGDGSLGMSAGELETLVRLKIPAVLIHFNNSCFGWIKALQSIHTDNKFFSVDFNSHDPAMVAKGFGMAAHRVTAADELEPALEKAFSAGEPVFLDVITESEVTELPPVMSWQAKVARNKEQQAARP